MAVTRHSAKRGGQPTTSPSGGMCRDAMASYSKSAVLLSLPTSPDLCIDFPLRHAPSSLVSQPRTVTLAAISPPTGPKIKGATARSWPGTESTIKLSVSLRQIRRPPVRRTVHFEEL